MNKKELRDFLNLPSTNASNALYKLKEFFTDKTNRAIVINYIVTYLRDNKKNKKDTSLLFYYATKQLVEKTRLCKTDTASYNLLMAVWNVLNIHNEVVSRVKDNYKLIEIKTHEPELTKPEKPKRSRKQKETPEERAERFRKHTAYMRQQKAKKKAEAEEAQKRKEEAERVLENHRKLQDPKSSKNTPSKDAKETKKDAKVSEAYLMMLKNMKV
jgi:type IV secretory pathway VirB10-like protein